MKCDYITIQDGEAGHELATFTLASTGFSWPPPEELWLVATDTFTQTEKKVGTYFFLGTYDLMVKQTFHPSASVTPLKRHYVSQISDELVVRLSPARLGRHALYFPA